jgi:hypothetical protein
MRKLTLIIAGLALLAMALPSQSRADACGAIGNASGCNITVTFGGGGSIVTTPGDPNPYDGVEDQLVGIINNSGKTINSITLSGSGIFNLEAQPFSDGAGMNGGACTADGLGGTFGCLQTGPFGPTGYEGPNTSFSIVDSDNGTVFFTGGLANGSTAWFSLEAPTGIAGFTVGGVNGVPEPSPLFLLGSGFVSLLGFARRRLAA